MRCHPLKSKHPICHPYQTNYTQHCTATRLHRRKDKSNYHQNPREDLKERWQISEWINELAFYLSLINMQPTTAARLFLAVVTLLLFSRLRVTVIPRGNYYFIFTRVEFEYGSLSHFLFWHSSHLLPVLYTLSLETGYQLDSICMKAFTHDFIIIHNFYLLIK